MPMKEQDISSMENVDSSLSYYEYMPLRLKYLHTLKPKVDRDMTMDTYDFDQEDNSNYDDDFLASSTNSDLDCPKYQKTMQNMSEYLTDQNNTYLNTSNCHIHDSVRECFHLHQDGDENLTIMENLFSSAEKMNERNFKCQYQGCSKTFSSKPLLKVHERDHTQDAELMDETQEEHFRAVIGANKKITNSLISSSKKINVRIFKCQYQGCYKTFSSKLLLKVHERDHIQDAELMNKINEEYFRAGLRGKKNLTSTSLKQKAIFIGSN